MPIGFPSAPSPPPPTTHTQSNTTIILLYKISVFRGNKFCRNNSVPHNEHNFRDFNFCRYHRLRNNENFQISDRHSQAPLTKLMYSPVVLAVGNGELEVAVLTEVPLQPVWLCPNLVKDSKEHLFGCHGSIEDADTLAIGAAGVSPCLN